MYATSMKKKSFALGISALSMMCAVFNSLKDLKALSFDWATLTHTWFLCYSLIQNQIFWFFFLFFFVPHPEMKPNQLLAS